MGWRASRGNTGRGKYKKMGHDPGRNLVEVRKKRKGEGVRSKRLGGCWGRASSALARGGRLKAESQQAVEERNKS